MKNSKESVVRSSANWQHLPTEICSRPQWMVAGPSKAPLGVDASGRTYNGSVTKPTDWLGFNTAAKYAAAHGLLIGYVLTADDPFCVIDLDWCNEESQASKGQKIDPKKWTTPQDAERYWRIVTAFDSYTERSTSGNGLHIIVRANIGEGRRRDGVEVYSQQRFMVCTGDVIHRKPIEGRQQLIDRMLAEMPANNVIEMLFSEPARMNDQAVLLKFKDHVYVDKFVDLWNGDWEQYGFPSRSEADQALMGYIARVSMNNDQCMRLFMRSKLAQRAKYTEVDDQRWRYLMNRMLRLIRGDQARDRATVAAVQTAMAPAIEQAMKKPRK